MPIDITDPIHLSFLRGQQQTGDKPIDPLQRPGNDPSLWEDVKAAGSGLWDAAQGMLSPSVGGAYGSARPGSAAGAEAASSNPFAGLWEGLTAPYRAVVKEGRPATRAERLAQVRTAAGAVPVIASLRGVPSPEMHMPTASTIPAPPAPPLTLTPDAKLSGLINHTFDFPTDPSDVVALQMELGPERMLKLDAAIRPEAAEEFSRYREEQGKVIPARFGEPTTQEKVFDQLFRDMDSGMPASKALGRYHAEADKALGLDREALTDRGIFNGKDWNSATPERINDEIARLMTIEQLELKKTDNMPNGTIEALNRQMDALTDIANRNGAVLRRAGLDPYTGEPPEREPDPIRRSFLSGKMKPQ